MTDDQGGTAEHEPANGLEEEARRLQHAEEAVQQAIRSAEKQGPAMQHLAHAVLQVLKYAAHLGIHLNELTDAFLEANGVAGVAREMTAIGRLVDEAGGKLAAPPTEIAARLASIKAATPLFLDPAPQTVHGTVHQNTLMLPFPDVNRLIGAANLASMSVVDFATKAILDAIDHVERGKPAL
jgi:hypothetical protein